jgi:hypothetical protein
MNRILTAVERTRKLIDSAKSEGKDLTALNQKMNMSFEEWTKFQEKKSLAQAGGILTYEEATTVYGFLGSGPDEFNRQDLAVKVTLTKAFAELMAA